MIKLEIMTMKLNWRQWHNGWMEQVQKIKEVSNRLDFFCSGPNSVYISKALIIYRLQIAFIKLVFHKIIHLSATFYYQYGMINCIYVWAAKLKLMCWGLGLHLDWFEISFLLQEMSNFERIQNNTLNLNRSKEYPTKFKFWN